MADRRKQPDFIFCVPIGLAMLQIDDSNQLPATKDWNGKKCLKRIFRYIWKALEAWILQRIRGDRYRLAMPSNPPGDALAKPNAQMIHQIRMRVLGCAQNQLIVFQHIDETGIAVDDCTGKVNNAIEYGVQQI